MSYTPTEWKNGDIITEEKLNKIQEGIENLSTGEGYMSYTPTEWKNGDIITEEKMNKIQEAIENLSTGGGGGASKKDVSFYDYDGTLLHSYTAAEALDLTALPENPLHSGLTAQGWNWSLSDMKSQVQSMGKCDIGQMYITDDGKTRIYVHFEEGQPSPYLGIGVNGTVEVDWGDGSSTSTLTGTALTTVQTEQHVYAPGDYVIKLTVVSGSFSFFGEVNAAHILKKSTATTANISRVYANAVQKIELGSGVADIGANAFSGCSSLASITIPSSVTSIGANAFYNCYSLVSITIPTDVISIAGNAFQYCYSVASITIPSGVADIGDRAFQYCSSLASITIPSSVTSIGANAFYNCYSLASVTIPSSVTSIGASVFSGCRSLVSITIPSGVTSIGGSAFSDCSSLASITIPIGVTSIGASVFSTCYSLSSITIPDGVTSIGTSVFQNCYGVAEYHLLPTTPPTLANKNAFTGIQSDCIIYVPQGCLEAYQTATNWSTYASYMQEEAA